MGLPLHPPPLHTTLDTDTHDIDGAPHDIVGLPPPPPLLHTYPDNDTHDTHGAS